MNYLMLYHRHQVNWRSPDHVRAAIRRRKSVSLFSIDRITIRRRRRRRNTTEGLLAFHE